MPREVRSAVGPDGAPVAVEVRDSSGIVSLPEARRRPIDSVVEIRLDG